MIQRYEPEDDDSPEVLPLSQVVENLGDFLAGKLPWGRRQSWKMRIEGFARGLRVIPRD